MKNSIELIEPSDLLTAELPLFSPEANAKLASHLKGDKVEPQSLTDEDLHLFRKVAERFNIKSLYDVCELARGCRYRMELPFANHEEIKVSATAPPQETKELPETREKHEIVRPKEKPVPKPRPRGINRNRTQSETVAESKAHEQVRRLSSTQSLDLPVSLDRPRHIFNSYMILVGEAGGKTGVVVYRLQNIHSKRYAPNIHQKVANINKKTQYLKSVCCGYVDDAPFLFFLHVNEKNRVDLTAYDVIDDKMKPRACLKSKCELTSMVNVGGLLVCFQRNSKEVQLFNIAKKKWLSPFTLEHEVNIPVLVVHDETVYIFYERTMQRYDVNIGRVMLSDISEYVTSGHGFMHDGRVNILSDSKCIEYDVMTGQCRRTDFPHLNFRRIHKVFVRNSVVYALTTNETGKYELHRSYNLEEWQKELSFPKTLEHLVCTVLVDYFSRCPFAPFQSFNESIKSSSFSLW